MTPESASWHEWLRLGMALLGILVAWRGRLLVRRQVFKVPSTLDARQFHLLHDEWEDRMALYHALQWSIVGVHVLLMVNVTTNLFYVSAPLDQPNVATSNIMQVMVPGILIRASELISARVRIGGRAADRAAEPTESQP